MKSASDLVRVRLSKGLSIEVEPFWRCVGRGCGPLGSKAAARDATRLRAVVPRPRLRIALENILFDIGPPEDAKGCAARRRRATPLPSKRPRRHAAVARSPLPPARPLITIILVGATALTTSSNRLPSAPRRTPTTASLKMEDFGLLKARFSITGASGRRRA